MAGRVHAWAPREAFAYIVSVLLLIGAGCGSRDEEPPSDSPRVSARAAVAQQWAEVRSGQRDGMDLTGTEVSDADLAPLAAESQGEALPADGRPFAEDAAEGDSAKEGTGAEGALRELRLGRSQLTQRGIAAIAGVDSLEVLVLGETRLDDVGAAHLARLPRLRILNVPLAEITDQGLASLAAIRSLELLRVGSPRLTDAGLAALAGHPNLRQLIVVDTPLTDAAVEHIRQIERLESLYLFQTRLSDDALRELQSLVPHVHVD